MFELSNKLYQILKDSGLSSHRIQELLESRDNHVHPCESENMEEQLLCLHRKLCKCYGLYKHEIEVLDAYFEQIRDRLSRMAHAQYLHLKAYHRWKIGDHLFNILHFLNQSIKILHEIGTLKAYSYMGRVHDTYAQVLQRRGQYVDAIYEFRTAIKWKEQYDSEDSLALTRGNIGRLYLETGKYKDARDMLLQDVNHIHAFRDLTDNELLLAKLYLSIGMCSVFLKDYEIAEFYIDMSRQINFTIEDDFGLLLCQFSITILRLNEKDLEKAAEMINKLEKMVHNLDEDEKKLFVPWLKKLHGDYSILNDDHKEAYEFYKDAVENYKSSGTPIHLVDRIKFFLDLGRVCIKLDKQDEASEHYEKAMELLDFTDNEELRREVEKELEEHLYESWLLYNSGRFIGHKHVVKLLKKSGHQGFDGGKRQAVVLFSDIRDFTTVSEKFAPDRLIVFLNAYLEAMTRCVEYCGGYVDKFIGDAILGVFSLFDKEGNMNLAAENAVYAALLMQEEMIRFNRSLPDGIPKMKMGVGIHFGEVVAGLIGSPQKRSYTVIGDTVNTASRLESMTKRLQRKVVISKKIQDLLVDSNRFEIEELGSFVLKGKTNETNIASITAAD